MARLKKCEEHETGTYKGSDGRHRCRGCNSRNVSRRRLRIKQLLVQEAGGSCQMCGYNRCLAALQFHHLDPAHKIKQLSSWSGSLEAARLEAGKCQLLCANCHAEVEVGFSP